MHRLAPALLVTGIALLATAWLAEPAAPAPSAPTANVPAPLVTLAPALHDLDAQVERLRTRTPAPPAPPAPSRDPFRFGRRAAVAPPPASPAESVAVPSSPAPPALPRLIAILTEPRDGATVRTAVVSSGDGVVVVREGDTIGAFLVRAIDRDGVDLQQKSSQTAFRLSLR